MAPFESTELGELRIAADELKHRFGTRVPAAYLPGKTFFRDALYERLGVSQGQAEDLCDSLERAGVLRFVHSTVDGDVWTIPEDASL
jgi:hypothetical protein